MSVKMTPITSPNDKKVTDRKPANLLRLLHVINNLMTVWIENRAWQCDEGRRYKFVKNCRIRFFYSINCVTLVIEKAACRRCELSKKSNWYDDDTSYLSELDERRKLFEPFSTVLCVLCSFHLSFSSSLKRKLIYTF